MNKMKKTPNQWFKNDLENGCAYRTLAWEFDKPKANQKITEEEYVKTYVHPLDRWKI